jgi:hypothetical protein
MKASNLSNKKFIVSIDIYFNKGKYYIEFMRSKLNKDGGLHKSAKSKFRTYSFKPDSKYSSMFFMLFYNDQIFQRPSTHFGSCPMTSVYTRYAYDFKRRNGKK